MLGCLLPGSRLTQCSHSDELVEPAGTSMHTSAAAVHRSPAAQGPGHYCTALFSTPEPGAGHYCTALLPTLEPRVQCYCTALLFTPEPGAGPHGPSTQTLPREWGFTLMENSWSEQEDRTALVPVCCECQHVGSGGFSAANPTSQKSFSGGRSPSLHLPTAHPGFHQHMHYWCLLGNAATGRSKS